MFRKIQVTDHFGLPHGSATLTQPYGRVCQFPSRSEHTKALVLSFEGEIHDYNVETNFAHLNLWVCMFLFLCNLGWIQLSGG